VVPVHARVRIGVEVVAETPLPRYGVVIGSDLEVPDAEPLPLSVEITPAAKASHLGCAHGPPVGCLVDVAEDFVVGAVLFHNEDHVANAIGQRPGRVGVRGESIGLDDERRVRRQLIRARSGKTATVPWRNSRGRTPLNAAHK